MTMHDSPAPTSAPEAEPALPSELMAAIEAVVMVAESPVEPRVLAQLVEVGVDAVEAACEQLAETYRAEGRGFELVRVGGGYRYQSHPDQTAYVERFVIDGQTTRLSAAALETLAIVAYKQPISRAQIAAIRGVSVDAVVRTLSHRGYIEEVARDPGPGQAVLYGTSQLFLEKMGIDSVADLPELGAFVPEPDIVEALEAGLRVETPDVIDLTDSPRAPNRRRASASRSCWLQPESRHGGSARTTSSTVGWRSTGPWPGSATRPTRPSTW